MTFNTMRIGMCGFYPIPATVEPSYRIDWFIGRAAELGCTALQVGGMPTDPDTLRRLRDLALAKNVELETGAGGVLGLVGPEAAESHNALMESIRIAQQLGTRVIRSGYGQLNVETSRFNKRTLSEQFSRIIANLQEAAKIVEDHDMFLAMENHCDFTGKQWAEIYDAVGSPRIGAALDTANGFTVFCDPNDDVRDLAPYTITTHLKDMMVVNIGKYLQENNLGDGERPWWRIPMLPVGCAVGEGHLDVPATLRSFAEHNRYGEGLHLIIEIGWVLVPMTASVEELYADVFHRSLRYLQEVLPQCGVSQPQA